MIVHRILRAHEAFEIERIIHDCHHIADCCLAAIAGTRARLERGRINITLTSARQIAHVLERDSRGLFREVRTGRIKDLRRWEGDVTGVMSENAVSGSG